MRRPRWFLLPLVAGAAAWAAWRFLPRDWLRLRRGGAPAHPRPVAAGSAHPGPEPPPGPPRPTAAPAGTIQARVIEPQGGKTLDEAAPEPTAEPPRCAAVTQSGTRCSREPEPGSAYCWQHAPP